MPPAAKNVQQRTFLRSLRIALHIATVFGVVPYSLRRSNVVLGIWKLFYNVFSSFITPIFGFLGLALRNVKLNRSFFSMFVFTFQYIFYSTSIISFLISNIVYRRNMKNASLQLLKVERLLFLLNVESKISYNYLLGVVFPLFVVCYAAAHMILGKVSDFSEMTVFVTFHYGNLYFISTKVLILFFLDTIQRYLDTLLHRASSREAVLVRLCIIQDRLADVISNIQNLYGLPVLCTLLSGFAFINCNFFIIIKMYNRPGALALIGWVFIVFSISFKIFNACEKMKDKGDEFHTLLYRIMKKDNSYNLLNNHYLRAHLLKKKSFAVNAAGFGEIDLKFLAGMISATATYTVILLQMGKNF